METIKTITISGFIKDVSDLHQFDAKKIIARLLDVSEENIFPLEEGKKIYMHLTANYSLEDRL